VAREGEIPFLDHHRLMSWWANSHTLYTHEPLDEDALHMTNRSYECSAIRLADLVPALSRKDGSPPFPDEQPPLQGTSMPAAALPAGS
jgi:hypothetical protein